MATFSTKTLETLKAKGPRGEDVVLIHNLAFRAGFSPDSGPADRELQRDIMEALEAWMEKVDG